MIQTKKKYHIMYNVYYIYCIFCRDADAIHVMAYDLRSSYEGFLDVHSPLHARTIEPPGYKHINVVCK